MAEFAYKGRAAGGDLVSGTLQGDSPDAVASRLLDLGITPVDIQSVKKRGGGMDVGELWRQMGGGNPTTKDLILFCRQMYTITKSGLPLLRGLNGLIESTHNIVLREALEDVTSSLESGRGLAASFGRHPRIFPRLFVSIVEMGEATGTLDTAFQRMYEYLSMDQDIRDRVKSAVRYPIIVLVAIGIAIAIITLFVIPNFEPIFRALGDDIPLPTRIIMGASDVAVNHWPLILVFMAALAVGTSLFVRTESGRYKWDRIKLQIPGTGSIVRNAALSRIARSLAVALEAGLPINQTLAIIATGTGNSFLGERVLKMRDGVERGEALVRTARAADLFPPLVLQMVGLGEETGALPELMHEAADFYQREVDYDLENLSAAIEPILIIAIGGIVLVLALGVFLPMWDMVSKARGM